MKQIRTRMMFLNAGRAPHGARGLKHGCCAGELDG